MLIDLELAVGAPAPGQQAGPTVRYGFELGLRLEDDGRWVPTVEREWFHDGAPSDVSFVVERGELTQAPDYLRGPISAPGSLLLPGAARWQPFSAIHSALTGMSFHTVVPAVMRRVVVRSNGRRLGPSGERLGEVIGYLAERAPSIKQRIDDYVAAIVPGAVGIDEYPLDQHSTVRLRIGAAVMVGTSIAVIVEGDGEVAAVPVLLRRIVGEG
jgi:hypothetical protein